MIKYFLLTLSIFFIGCDKSGVLINVEEYFPNNKLEGKTIVYDVARAPFNKQYDKLTFKNNCVVIKRKYPKFTIYDENHTKKVINNGGYTFTYCIDAAKKNIYDSHTNTILLNSKGVWENKNKFSGTSVTEKCKVANKYKDRINGKTYDLISIECKSYVENIKIVRYYIMAKGIGIVEGGNILNSGTKFSSVKLSEIR